MLHYTNICMKYICIYLESLLKNLLQPNTNVVTEILYIDLYNVNTPNCNLLHLKEVIHLKKLFHLF